jgi:bifunctional UDP-N-acetylglucosamine pyrophosphorylase/glucosamine-1-phosphate N-acetyltransferase
MSARWTAVIMAAGQGTRMRSSVPKVAHALAGRAVVRHVVECARAAGAADVVVVVGAAEQAGAVRAAAGEGARFAVQDQQLGTAHAVECAREACADAGFILVLNGDVPLVLPQTLRRLMQRVEAGDAELAVLTARVPVEEYGVLEIDSGRAVRIIETKAMEGVDRAEPQYINSGQYAVRAEWLWERLPRIAPAPGGERYLTQLAELASGEGIPAAVVEAEDPDEVRGINDRVQLAEAEAVLRARILRAHMLAGVTVVDPASTFVDAGVQVGADTVLEPQTHLRGETAVGGRCTIGPAAVVLDSTIGDGCHVRQSTVEGSTLEADVEMGPFSHLRPGSYICTGVHIGNFAEVKGSRLGARTKMGHFSYIGDADVGADVNIGAGTITANYDGAAKHRTVIGDGAFIGSDTMLVAPVRIGAGARTAAGAVVNRDVPDGMLAVGAPARIRRTGRDVEDGAER